MAPSCDSSRGALRVFVIDDAGSGTSAALHGAARLARGLDAEITLLAAVEVPMPLAVDEPSVSITFLENKLRNLMLAARVTGRVELNLCRDRESAVRGALPPNAIVVLSGSKTKKLARTLSLDGHKVFLLKEAHNS